MTTSILVFYFFCLRARGKTPAAPATQDLIGIERHVEGAAEKCVTMITGVHHHSVTVSDLDRSIRFYKDTLGLKLLYTTASNGDELSELGVKSASEKLAVLKAGDSMLELIQYVTPKDKSYDNLPCDVGTMHIAFRVSNVNEMYDELMKKGIKFDSPPIKVEEGPMKGWIWTYFKDPDGAQLELVEERTHE